MKSPDQICSENADLNIQITIKWLDKEKKYILIKGTKSELEFLGNLLLSQASYKSDDSFFLGPNGSGNKLFSNESEFGIYILRDDNNTKKTV